MFILESPSRNSFVKAGKHENISTIMAIYQKKNFCVFYKTKNKSQKNADDNQELEHPCINRIAQ